MSANQDNRLQLFDRLLDARQIIDTLLPNDRYSLTNKSIPQCLRKVAFVCFIYHDDDLKPFASDTIWNN